MTPATQPQPDAYQVLDPRTLGRPVHLLSAFSQRFCTDLSIFMRDTLDRRYGTQLQVSNVTLTRAQQADEPRRWNVYESRTGRIGLALDRSLVLRILHCRYGVQGNNQQTDPDTTPITASEERLTQNLGQQMVVALASRIRKGLQPLATAASPTDADQISWHAESTDTVGSWLIQVRIEEPLTGLQTGLEFSLDDAWMHVLLSQLAAKRLAPKEPSKSDAQPLASRLQVKLVAQLLQRRMAMGDILDMRVGDIIPVSLQTTDVLVRNTRLFTATVAEHRGKLWLTAFNDTK